MQLMTTPAIAPSERLLAATTVRMAKGAAIMVIGAMALIDA